MKCAGTGHPVGDPGLPGPSTRRADRNTQTLRLLIAAQNATRGPQWWYMSVLILIMVVPVVAMAIALERYIRRGLLIGAVKG